MGQILESLIKVYDASKIGSNSALDNYPLMSSPLAPFFIIVSYLTFVLYLGPRIMNKRKPVEIKKIMIVYNIYQIIFSSYLIIAGWSNDDIREFGSQLGCLSEGVSEETISAIYQLGWLFLINKIVELLDTVFFVLKKKQSHVSFLHVYHHCNVVIFIWCFLKYTSDEQGIVFGFFNSVVHVFMYFYYLLAALGPKFKKFLGWKRFLTALQILQFVLVLVYFGILFYRNCPINFVCAICLGINAAVFLILFLKYYFVSYVKKDSIPLSNV